MLRPVTFDSYWSGGEERHCLSPMPEIDHSKGDVAHHLSEGEEESRPGIHPAIEIVEAILLALVAVATAWSAYQADLWTGHQAELYGLASKLRVEAEGAATVANQERSYDASTVAEWLNAEAGRHQKLADIFQRRFVPEFRPAFEAWKKTDPLNNPNAPAKPELMPEYRNAKTEEASCLSKQQTYSSEVPRRENIPTNTCVRR